MGFFVAPRLALGVGALEQLSGLGAQRATVVVDPAVRSLERFHRVEEELAKTAVAVEVMEAPTLTISAVTLASERVRATSPDWIVAVGGGACIDAAKAVWVGVERPDLNWGAVNPLAELGLRHRARFAAVPTTSGSGREAGWTLRLPSAEGGTTELASRELVADWAILDPLFPASLSPALTAESGAEALTHALEAIASEWSNPFSDALARDAVGVLVRDLPKLAKHADELDLRAEVHYAASAAGIALSNAQAGLAQALTEVLLLQSSARRGRVAAAILPFVLEFNFPAARERYLSLGSVLGGSVTQHRSSLAEKVRSLWDLLGLPRTLAGAGIDPGQLRTELPRLVEQVVALPAAVANPRMASRDELLRLLECALDGTPVSF